MLHCYPPQKTFTFLHVKKKMGIHRSIYYLDSSSPTEHPEQERDQEEAQETFVPGTNPGAPRP